MMASPTDHLPAITVAPLQGEEIDAAYALIRLGAPDCSLETWKDYFAAWQATPAIDRGLLSARNRRGFILGVMPWWRQPRLGGTALWAGPAWIFEPGIRPHVTEALVSALEDKAARCRCRNLVLVYGDRVREQPIQPAARSA